MKLIQGLGVPEGKLGKIDFSTVGFAEFAERLNIEVNLLPGSIETSQLSLTLIHFLGHCRIQVNPDDIKALKKKIKLIKTQTSAVSKSQALSILNDWFNTIHTPQDLRSKIMKSIQDFEGLKSNALTIDEKSSLDNLIYSLKVQLKKAPVKLPNASEDIIQKSRLGLSEIFKHYSKQQFLIGKNPTFDFIQKNLEVLNMAKFLKFCKDFEIIQGNPNEREQRKKVKVVQKVYKSQSDFNKDMHEHQFFKAVEVLAGVVLNEEYDFKHATCWNLLSQELKIERFFEVMGFHDPGIYNKKLKDIGMHFGTDNYSRIPTNDASKRYKYDAEKYRKLKMSVDEWKARKYEEQKKKVKKKPNERIGSKISTRRFESYSSVNKGNFRARLISEKFQEKVPEDDKQSSEESKPFTFQSLKELKLEDLSKFDQDYSIKDLIVDTEDQFLSEYLQRPQYSEKKQLLHKSQSAYLIPSNRPLKTDAKLPAILKNSDHQPKKLMNTNK